MRYDFGSDNTAGMAPAALQGLIDANAGHARAYGTDDVTERAKEQIWQRIDLGHQMPFPTITGGIFEAGFPDCFLQMWAAFAAERAGALGDRFGCVHPDEAVRSHELFAAALESHARKVAVALPA